jgi:hypothetical protein
MFVAAQRTFSWGYAGGSLLFGIGGLWYNYRYIGSVRERKKSCHPPAQLQAGGKIGSFFFLGCALIIGVSPFVHHKISILGAVWRCPCINRRHNLRHFLCLPDNDLVGSNPKSFSSNKHS